MSSSQAKAIAKKVHKEQDKLHPDAVVQPVRERALDEGSSIAPRTPGQPAEQFPADYSAKEKKDDIMAARLELQKGMGTPGVTPFGVMHQTDDDVKWLLRKQQAAELANFENWFAREYDHMDPASKAWAREKLPQFYAKRQKLLKDQAKNLQRLASIKLNGVQSKDDLVTLYAAETGRLDIGPLNHLLNPETAVAQRNAQRNFTRGLLNPRRFVFGDEGGTQSFQQRGENISAMYKGYDGASFRPGAELGLRRGFPPYGGSSTALGAAPAMMGQVFK